MIVVSLYTPSQPSLGMRFLAPTRRCLRPKRVLGAGIRSRVRPCRVLNTRASAVLANCASAERLLSCVIAHAQGRWSRLIVSIAPRRETASFRPPLADNASMPESGEAR
jgi:hypothetical protein